MNRRKFLAGVSGLGSISVSGCLNNIRTKCEEVDVVKSQSVVDTTSDIDSGTEWSHNYECRAGDSVSFEIESENDVELNIDIQSPNGDELYSESGSSFSFSEDISNGGTGEVNIRNISDGDVPVVMNDTSGQEELDGNAYTSYSQELESGDIISYDVETNVKNSIHLYVENGDGDQVSSTIDAYNDGDAEFEIEEDGEYTLFIENSSGNSVSYEYLFEFIREFSGSSSVSLVVEREYEGSETQCEERKIFNFSL